MRELPVLVLALVLTVLVLAPVHVGVCNSVRALTVVEKDGGGGGGLRRLFRLSAAAADRGDDDNKVK